MKVIFNPGHPIGVLYCQESELEAVRAEMEEQFPYLLVQPTPGCIVLWVSKQPIELCPTRGAKLKGSSSVQLCPLHDKRAAG